MPLKGAMRGKQALKTWCLAKECHGESPEACIALRLCREAASKNGESLRVYRHPLSLWASAVRAISHGEKHALKRHNEAKASSQQVVLG